MPITYVIDRGRGVVVARVTGVLTADDLYHWRAEMQLNPDFDPTHGQLCDLRDVTDVAISVPAMARVAASTVFVPGSRHAVICANEIQYGMARMFAMLSEPHGHVVHVFRELGVAEQWVMEHRRDA
jgi:hypothetical protein